MSDFHPPPMTAMGRMTGADLYSDGRQRGRKSVQVELERLPRGAIAVCNLFTSFVQNDLVATRTEVGTATRSPLHLTYLVKGSAIFWLLNVVPIICIFPELKWGQLLFHPKKKKKKKMYF